MIVDIIPLVPTYLELLRQWRNLNRDAFFDTREISVEDQAKWYEAYKSAQGEVQYIVMCNDEPVGTFAIINGDPIEFIRVMIGRKDLIGKGIMKTALNQAFALYPSKSAKLKVKADNVEAIGLYKSCGFRVVKSDDIIVEMERRVESEVLKAARRMGFEVDYLPDSSPYFDEKLLMVKPPPRNNTVAIVGDPRDQLLANVRSILRADSIACDLTTEKDLRGYQVAIGRTGSIPAQSAGLAACASGCMFISIDTGNLPYLASDRDFIKLPFKSFGVTGVPGTDHFSYPDLNVVAAVANGFVSTNGWIHVAEDVRRIVSTYATSARVALNELKALGKYDDSPFYVHKGRFEQANDLYQWPGERELFYALLSTLKAQGSCVEVGIGNGGTLSVLAAFGNRETVAIDNFSYSKDGDQERAVAHVMGELKNINLIAANSHDVHWDRPIAFLHIDGGHDFADADADLRKFAPHVTIGGIMAVDDYATRMDQSGVSSAVDPYIAENFAKWLPITMSSKVAFWRRVA